MVQAAVVGVDLGVQGSVAFWADTERVERVSGSPSGTADWLRRLVAQDTDVTVLVESPTEPLVQAAVHRGVRVLGVNPAKVASFRRATSTSNAKDDARDARTLVAFHDAHPRAFRPVFAESPHLQALRIALIERERVVETIVRDTNQLREDLRSALPVAACHLNQALDRQWFLKMLMVCPTSLDVDAVDDATTLKRLQKNLKVDTVDAARERLACNPFALAEPVAQQFRERIVWCASRVLEGVRRRAKLRKRIHQLTLELIEQGIDKDEPQLSYIEVLQSFPGMGTILLAALLVEVPELCRNELPELTTLHSYSGVRPVTRQSGTRTTVTMRRAKNKRLHNMLVLLARVSTQASDRFKRRYSRLRSRGKTHRTALRITASTILDTLHAMLRDRTLYKEPGTPPAT